MAFWNDIAKHINDFIHAKCRRDLELLNSDIISKQDFIDALNFKCSDLENKYNLIKEPDISKPPVWLDESKDTHKPSILVFEKGLSYWVQIGTKDIYASSPALEKLVEQKNWRGMPLNQKLLSIWGHVINHIKYRYDQSESWEYPTTTHYRKYGDCEDGTIYFVTLCMLAGVPANKVFNAVGMMGSIGHSWPIVKMEDDKWYIMETTLDFIPDHPKPFKDSAYKASWGVYNHRFGGGIANVDKQV